MTGMDRMVFIRIMSELAEIYNADVSEQRTDAYWEALKDVPLSVFEKASRVGAKEWRRFPVPAAILEVCDRVSPAVSAAIATAPPGLSEFDVWCRDCEDTGWRPVVRTTRVPVAIADTIGNWSDYAVRPCPCRETNPQYQRQRAKPKYGNGEQRYGA